MTRTPLLVPGFDPYHRRYREPRMSDYFITFVSTLGAVAGMCAVLSLISAIVNH